MSENTCVASLIHLILRILLSFIMKKYFNDNIETIYSTINFFCRNKQIIGEDKKDFSSQILIKVIDNDYKVLRSYNKKSKLTTYLLTVISNYYIDLKRKEIKRWRPSKKSKNKGPIAVKLDELINKKNYTLEEAHDTLTINHNYNVTLDELSKIASEFKNSTRQIRKVSDTHLTTLTDNNPHTEEAIIKTEDQKTVNDMIRVSVKIRENLPGEAKLILKMRFFDDYSISQIGRMLNIKRHAVDKILKDSLKEIKDSLIKEDADFNEITKYINENF